MYAGMDASGTPDLRGTNRGHNPYIVVLAAVEDVETLTNAFRELRMQFGMRETAEFHGHQMPEKMLLDCLQQVLDIGLLVGALLVDKDATRRERTLEELPNAADFQIMAALALAEPFISRYLIAELLCDEDIRGKERQQGFITGIKRLQRSVWPEARIRVQFRPSNKSDLIQLADMVAYALGIQARGTLRSNGLRRLVDAIRTSETNLITGPEAWKR